MIGQLNFRLDANERYRANVPQESFDGRMRFAGSADALHEPGAGSGSTMRVMSMMAALVVGASGCARDAPDAAIAGHASDAPTAPHALHLTEPARLNAILDGYVDSGSVPLMYARLEDRAGNLLYEHGATSDVLLPGIEVDGETWLRIWSMSKSVTISLALDLVEAGELSLDDRVTRWIPEFANLVVAQREDGSPLTVAESDASACPLKTVAVSTPMTVRHLINHEAGFYYALTGIDCLDAALAAKNIVTAANSDELIARLAALPLIQQPGASYHYGMNTTVLGLVAERVSGQTLQALVAERLTGPLGIDGLQYPRPDGVSLLPRFSGADGVLREARPGELDIFGPDVPDYEPDHALYLGGEGMLATASGYADYLRMLLNGGALDGARLLDPETVDEMAAPHTQLDSEWGHNGYNLWVNSGKLPQGGDGRGGLWIVGGYEGTHGWVDPELGLVGVVVSQIHRALPDANLRHEVFREAVYDQLLPERRGTR